MNNTKEIDLNIRQFKLMNGEEIVALVHSKDDHMIAIERPCKVHSNPACPEKGYPYKLGTGTLAWAASSRKAG